LQRQPAGKARRGPFAQRQPQVVDDVVEPGSAPFPRRQNLGVEALRKDGRPQSTVSQWKRRAWKTSRTGLLASGRSA